MLKKDLDERICKGCEKIIIGRRIDAVICKGCRRKAQEEASQKIKEKEERILNKVEETCVKSEIEYKKVREIVENLEKGHLEEIKAKAEHWLNPLSGTGYLSSSALYLVI